MTYIKEGTLETFYAACIKCINDTVYTSNVNAASGESLTFVLLTIGHFALLIVIHTSLNTIFTQVEVCNFWYNDAILPSEVAIVPVKLPNNYFIIQVSDAFFPPNSLSHQYPPASYYIFFFDCFQISSFLDLIHVRPLIYNVKKISVMRNENKINKRNVEGNESEMCFR